MGAPIAMALACTFCLAGVADAGEPDAVGEVSVRLVDGGGGGGGGRRLEFQFDATGLGDHGSLWLTLDGWGGWPGLDHEYVTVSGASPPLGARDGTRFPVLAPADWDGSLSVTYSIPLLEIGTPEQQAWNILPSACGTYATAALMNTIMRLDDADGPVAMRRTITIRAPEGWTVATGWAGASEGVQTSSLPAPDDNGVYVIGRPVGVATGDGGGVACEVYQFSGGVGGAARVLSVVRPFVEHVTRTVGAPPPETVRVCVMGSTGGGFLTDHGLVVGLPEGTPDWFLDSPYFRHLICHELYHTWLGNILQEAQPERTVWFKEGFTDYLSLWHGAACGVLPREWFVERLLEIEPEARATSMGRVAFTDPGVDWRDGDGPNEIMAYKGGMVLAFCLDAALREAGRPGLASMIGQMIEDGERRYSNQSIRERLRALGLGEFERRYVSGTEVVSVGEAMLALGCARRETATPLGYLGIRVEADQGFGRVVAIDPDGPASDSGFRIGDIVGGLAPGRSDGASVGDSVETAYPFGLELVAPTEEEVSVWVHRGEGEPVELRVRPRVIGGGVLSRIELTPKAEAALFGDG
ncbi:MAG: hypothetical protein R3B57_01135 [Phycisphaerales bacterium]